MAKPHLENPHSLRDRARAAHAQGLPLVVMTTLKGCPFCDVVRTNYLFPMHQKGEIVAVQLDITGDVPVEYFDGQWLTPREISRKWKNRVAPTIYFYGADGQELAERIEGMAVPDFFDIYLEQRLTQAHAALKGSRSTAH